MERLNTVSVAAPLPAFIALTFPDDCFPVTGKVAKSCLDAFLKRLHRVSPGACGFWRMEWQRRKSGAREGEWFPHFHLLIWGLDEEEGEDPHFPGYGISWFVVRCPDLQLAFDGVFLRQTLAENASAAGDGRKANRLRYRGVCSDWDEIFQSSFGHRALHEGVTCAMRLSDWVSVAWYYVVGSHNLNHLVAGTRCERVRSWAGVSSYCSKYFCKPSEEDEPPASGRLWGIFNRSCIPWANLIDIALPSDVGCRLRRVARRYLEHRLGRRVRRGYGITVFCDASRFVSRFLPPRAPPDPF